MDYACEDCGKFISSKRAKRCKRCAGIRNNPTKVNWPDQAVLLRMVEKDGYRKVAKQLGVSITSVRKRVGKY